MRTAESRQTLVSAVWPSQGAGALRATLLALVGTALLAVSAKVQVPFWPVPMTMQTMVVVLLGMAYGSRLGAATVALYLLEGAFGLPVFAGTPEKGIGLGYMMGPTGGYLIGFLAAAYVVGLLAERGFGRSVATTLAAMLAGNVILYAFGLTWLSVLVGWGKTITLGLLPFVPSTLLKIALAAAILPLSWKLVDRRDAE